MSEQAFMFQALGFRRFYGSCYDENEKGNIWSPHSYSNDNS